MSCKYRKPCNCCPCGHCDCFFSGGECCGCGYIVDPPAPESGEAAACYVPDTAAEQKCPRGVKCGNAIHCADHDICIADSHSSGEVKS
jgi:hypothetical protein